MPSGGPAQAHPSPLLWDTQFRSLGLVPSAIPAILGEGAFLPRSGGPGHTGSRIPFTCIQALPSSLAHGATRSPWELGCLTGCRMHRRKETLEGGLRAPSRGAKDLLDDHSKEDRLHPMWPDSWPRGCSCPLPPAPICILFLLPSLHRGRCCLASSGGRAFHSP